MRLRKEERKNAFTLTEVLIAVAIVGIIAGLVLPKLIENYQTKTMDSAFQREVQTIEDSINGLAVSENKADFFSTMMYKDTAPESYDDSVGMYMEKYLRTSKMCDNPKDCFAETYYQYESGKSRSEYKPDYKGACAILKNGMSICMIPQIGAANITGIIDLNGKKGPNVLNRDLRTFSIAAKTRVGLNQDTEGVYTLDWENIASETDPCDADPNGLDCCRTKTISDSTDVCCTYDEIKKNNTSCKSLTNLVASSKLQTCGICAGDINGSCGNGFVNVTVTISEPLPVAVTYNGGFGKNAGGYAQFKGCTIPAGSTSCTTNTVSSTGKCPEGYTYMLDGTATWMIDFLDTYLAVPGGNICDYVSNATFTVDDSMHSVYHTNPMLKCE